MSTGKFVWFPEPWEAWIVICLRYAQEQLYQGSPGGGEVEVGTGVSVGVGVAVAEGNALSVAVGVVVCVAVTLLNHVLVGTGVYVMFDASSAVGVGVALLVAVVKGASVPGGLEEVVDVSSGGMGVWVPSLLEAVCVGGSRVISVAFSSTIQLTSTP
ncbi:MAG: hypothetical protein GTO18_08135 [Anaerolineales bacterium]|nr:hypothetical protein [Anaerolineales bacterium]